MKAIQAVFMLVCMGGAIWCVASPTLAGTIMGLGVSCMGVGLLFMTR